MNKVIVLDPGHGGNATVGGSLHNKAVSSTGVLEKTMTLDFAFIIRNALLARSKEITVVLTRETDINLSLAARAGVAAAKHADLFLSIHFNASAGGRGVESWIRGTKRGSLGFAADSAFARRVQDAVLKAWRTYTHATRDLEVKNDDARELGLGVLKPAWLGNVAGRSSLCRACLVLLEFISDPEVDRLLNTGDNVQGVRKKIAGSLADALLEELGISFSVPAEPATPIVGPSVPVPGPKVDDIPIPEAPTISGSVGRPDKNAVNAVADVETVRQLLRRIAKRLGNSVYDPGTPIGTITSDAGDPTVKAIEAFQARFMSEPDGLINVGGRTWQELIGALGIGVSTEGFCFPFEALPKENWTSPPRSFGARRANGDRAHAGCDLYFPEGTFVHSVGPGVVTMKPTSEFYKGTFEIEIDHGAFTARYCEVQHDRFVEEGQRVKAGQVIGKVGKMNGLSVSMLHFELYDKSATGPLTVKDHGKCKHTSNGVPYLRRSDLLDPTPYLNSWQHFLPTKENLALNFQGTANRPSKSEESLRHEENLKERSGEVPSLARYLVQFFKGDYHQRQESANAEKCVAYVEQHFNSGRESDGYSAAVTARNASAKSKEWGRAYAKAIAREFDCEVGGDDGIAVGGFGGRGNENLFHTNMPAILLEPLFASDPVQAAFIRSDSGQERLARVLVATIRQFFPEGGLIAFSVGHKYKTSQPEDRGTEVVGGGFEADFAELVLKKAEKLLTARMEDDSDRFRSDIPQRRANKLETLPDANAGPAVHGAEAVRNFSACKRKVSDRGCPPNAFLNELVDWGLEAPDEIFAPSDRHDIYTNVFAKLGPWDGILHRKAVMLEVLRVLGGFESSWKWDEGRDTTNSKSNTAETEEAGLFQISANAMNFDRSLKDLLSKHSREGKTDAKTFNVTTKGNHAFAIEFAARLLRFTVEHNGPVKRKEINDWLQPDAVEELKGFLAHSAATSPQLTA